MLRNGDKIYVIARRGFENEVRRRFVDAVEACDGTLVKARGYTIVYDDASNAYVQHTEERVRILGLADSNLIINLIPDGTNIEDIWYEMTDGGRLCVTDGAAWRLDINEFNGRR